MIVILVRGGGAPLLTAEGELEMACKYPMMSEGLVKWDR